MPIQDLANDYLADVQMQSPIVTDTESFSSPLDTNEFDGGFMFTAAAYVYTDGTYVITLQDSPDNSVWSDVPDEKLNDPGGNGSMTLNIINVEGDTLQRLGAFSTERFIRAKVISTSTSSGATITINTIKLPNRVPQ